MLKKCYKNLQDPNSSEYMTWMLNRPDLFKVHEVSFKKTKLYCPEINLSVDYKKDYNNLCFLFNHYKGKIPDLEKVIKFVLSNPKIYKKFRKKINNTNRNYKHINVKYNTDR